MLSIAVRVGEVLALLLVAGILVLAGAAAFATWLRRRLRRLIMNFARALLVRSGLSGPAEAIASRRLTLTSWRLTLARAAWRAVTDRASRSSHRALDRPDQDIYLRAAR